MILVFFLWYLVISLVGWLTFPLAFRLLPGLPDRGYSFSRTLGWLLWGYLFWLLGSLGFLLNDFTGLLFALTLVLAASAWALRSVGVEALRQWWAEQRGFVLALEVVFLLAFAGLAVVRAANPQIQYTEKPMELAFINAILRSPTFPPHDPWLSGYAISYYYFGYVLVAMLARFTGTAGSIAFNLGIALVFALVAAGSFGLVYNLLAARAREGRESTRPGRFTWPALLGPLFVLLVGNLEGFLELLHARGLFWRSDEIGSLTSRFWTWLGILDLNQPPSQPFAWTIRQFGSGGWWWWRASRVIQDFDIQGRSKGDIISEFPAFSFTLADLHPHVLAMPFALLAVALALNLFLGAAGYRLRTWQVCLNLRTLVWSAVIAVFIGVVLALVGLSIVSPRLIALGVAGSLAGGLGLLRFSPDISQYGRGLLTRSDLGELYLTVPTYLRPGAFLVSAVVLGGMAFLNTWEFPTYVALVAGAYVLGQLILARQDAVPGSALDLGLLLRDFVLLGLTLGAAGGLLYLPFYLGFSSQAGGLLPNPLFVTRGAHFWVMFAPLLLPLFAFLIYQVVTRSNLRSLGRGLLAGFGLVLTLFVLMVVLGLLAAAVLPDIQSAMSANLGTADLAALLREAVLRRLVSPGAWVTLALLLSLAFALLLPLFRRESPGAQTGPHPAVDIFPILLIVFGGLLTIGLEHFYLLDFFGSRINNIFKFYFQTWQLWGVAAAFGSAVLLRRLPRLAGTLFSVGLIAVLAMGLTFTVFRVWDATQGFRPSTGWSLDGTAYYERWAPDEMAAIEWLKEAPLGVVAEVVGGSYTEYARVSSMSGQPAVLGWPGHENQWRGGYTEIGSREADIGRLYCSRDWTEAEAVIEQYNIRYIFVGRLERSTYISGAPQCPGGLNETKFQRLLDPVFQQGEITIYEVPGQEF